MIVSAAAGTHMPAQGFAPTIGADALRPSMAALPCGYRNPAADTVSMAAGVKTGVKLPFSPILGHV